MKPIPEITVVDEAREIEVYLTDLDGKIAAKKDELKELKDLHEQATLKLRGLFHDEDRPLLNDEE